MDGSFSYINGFLIALTLIWVGLCFATAILARKQGRNPAVWGILSAVLTPFLVVLLLLLFGKSTSQTVRQTSRRRSEVVKVRCSGCSAAVDERSSYCPECGQELQPAEA